MAMRSRFCQRVNLTPDLVLQPWYQRPFVGVPVSRSVYRFHDYLLNHVFEGIAMRENLSCAAAPLVALCPPYRKG